MATEETILLVERLHRLPIVALSGSLVVGGLLITSRPGLLLGFSINDLGTGSDILAYNGRDASGQLMVDVEHAAGGTPSSDVKLPSDGLFFDVGLFQVNADVLTTCVWYVKLFQG